MAALNFNASEVDPDEGQLGPVPAGWYIVVMDKSELKPTSNGAGEYLNCRFSVVDGEYKNRKIFTNLNLKNANPVAQEIAYKTLSAIAHAVGVIQVDDSVQLHDLPLKIRVRLKAADDEYDAQNIITAFKNVNDAVGTVAAVAPGKVAAKNPAAAVSAAKQPWANKPAAVAAAKPAAPAPKPQPKAADVEPVLVMLNTAEFTYEQYRESGWDDEQLIDGGLAEWQVPAAEETAAPAAEETAAPTAPGPKGPPAPAGKTAAAPAGNKPPWSKKKVG